MRNPSQSQIKSLKLKVLRHPLSDLQKLVSSEEIILELGSRLKPKTTKGKELTKLVIEQLGSAATPFTVVVTPENDVVHVYSERKRNDSPEPDRQ